MIKEEFIGIKDKNIFISYIEENRDIAELLWGRLTELGANPWAYTKNNNGPRWREEIVETIRKSDIMILIFSEETDQKANNQIVKELGLASDKDIEIIPFMIEDIDSIKNKEIAYELEGINWVRKETPLEKQIESLLKRIERFYSYKGVGNDSLDKGNAISGNTTLIKEKQKHFSLKYFLSFSLPILLIVLGYYVYQRIQDKDTNLFEKSANLITEYKVKKVDEKSLGIDKKKILTTNEDPSNIATLLTNNKSGTRWLSTINLRAGDNLMFNIHYYGWHKGINDLHIKIDSLNGKFFKEDERLSVNAEVLSKNLKPSYGQADIVFDEPAKLKLRHISWQKNKCRSFKCETLMPEDSSNIFSENGLSLGDVFAKDNSDYFGNIVVSYDVVKIKNNRTKGK